MKNQQEITIDNEMPLANNVSPILSEVPVRHILGLSGGKDSTALAIYMKDRVPQMEYIFTDTGEELPETYEYLDKLEVVLGKEIIRLNPDRPFTHYLHLYRGVLPDARTRWCTRMLKLKPFERYVGDGPVVSYVGIRADEDRTGYVSTKQNITARFPFKEDGITKPDVHRILEESGIGLPEYYKWRSRSGCYFCFFQQRNEWVGLLEQHPDLFEKAATFEKSDPETGKNYTWSQSEPLSQLAKPERIAAIKAEHQTRMEARKAAFRANLPLLETVPDTDTEDDEDDDGACLICTL